MSTIDAYVARFQNLPTFNIYAVCADDGLEPWFEVGGDDLVRELVVDELDYMNDVACLPPLIQKWGRLSAQARRVWEVEERKLRSWKARFVIKTIKDAEAAKEKRPAKDAIEAMYRADAGYAERCRAVERAEEACNAAEAVLAAFRAKKDLLVRFATVRRLKENGMA